MLLPILVIVKLFTSSDEKRIIVVHHYVVLIFNADIALKELIDIVNLVNLWVLATVTAPAPFTDLNLTTLRSFLATYMN
jgi:hypothetical protein